MSSPDTPIPQSLIQAIAQTIEQARGQVRNAVNQAMVVSYWQVGRLLVEHADYRADGFKRNAQLSSNWF